MNDVRPKQDLIALFNSLSTVPLNSASREEALTHIAELGREALGSRACSLIFVDPHDSAVTRVAYAGFGREAAERRDGRRRAAAGGDTGAIDYALIARDEGGAFYGLQEAGNRVVNPAFARQHGIRSVLRAPLNQNGNRIGYLNHFSASDAPFTTDEERLLEIFASQAVVILDRFEYKSTLERLTEVLGSLARALITVPEEEFLGRVSESACTLLDAPACIVWKFDHESGKLRIVPTASEVDDEYRRLELDPESQAHIVTRQIGYLPDVTRCTGRYYKHREEARARGWVSLLTAPMWVEERLIGMLDVYTRRPRHFKDWEKKFFATFADYAALSIQKAGLLREAEQNLRGRQKLEQLNEVIQEVSTATNMKDLLELILTRSLQLVGAEKGWIAKFDLKTGKLNIEAHRGEPLKSESMMYGEGITGLALKREEPIRVGDVRQGPLARVYQEYWPDTRSELAVPILVSNARARVGRRTAHVTKPIGVINIESPTAGAFTGADQDVLWSLARHAAIIIEKLELDAKFPEMHQLEDEIASAPGWDETMRVVLRAVTETLGFEYVNISLVDEATNQIKTEYVVGIPEEDVAAFKRLARHPLDGDDIQAVIVRTRAIEVPAVEDERFDQQVYTRFRHEKLIRVFLPLVSSAERVLGTVEAGYRRGYRKHIYEQDVRVLQKFVDYTARALERKRRALIPRILHEFEAPTVGIRNNVDYLKNSRGLGESLVHLKYDDILTDCELLLLKIGELEHILGGSSPVSKKERTLVYRDIIIKAVNQLRPLVAERGFDMRRIRYSSAEDVPRIKIYVDKAKLSSVVYNLLINSIKYAENDPSLFNIKITVKVTLRHYVIKFRDWGIGINRKYSERVFEEGFRAPEAAGRFVSGSGLGLAIARKAMREMGGDLILAGLRKPTEFQVLLPRGPKGGA